jgi:hypothetical protein
MRLRKCSRRGLTLARRTWFVICLCTVGSSTQFARALPGTTNLSLLPGVVPTVSDPDPNGIYDTLPSTAIDGNRDGNYGDGSLYYRNPPKDADGNVIGDSFYQLDLGTSAYIDRVQLLRRTDNQDGPFHDLHMTIYKDNGSGQPGAIAFQSDYLPNFYFAGPWGTTDPGATDRGGAAGGTFGRFVKISTDSPYQFEFSEFEVIGAKTPLAFTDANDIAIGKSVTTSSPPGYGALITSGNDGNIDGDFGAGLYRPVYHSSNAGVGEYWQVDLGSTQQLDHLQLFARGDNDVSQGDFGTTSQFKVTVFKSDGTTVAGTYIVDNNLLNTTNPGYDHIINTAGISGEFVRVETTLSQYLAFSELRAFVGPGSAFPTGDYNQDGAVNIQDYYTWKQAFGTTNAAADGNGNGIVDAGDYTIWRDHVASGSGSGRLGSASVPEPSSALLALGLLTLVRRRRRS